MRGGSSDIGGDGSSTREASASRDAGLRRHLDERVGGLHGNVDRIDAYLDAIARSDARAEPIGPFTLFVREGPGWPFYGRPSPGATSFTPNAVRAVRARQQELEIPETFEWVVDLAPQLASVLAASGLAVTERPLMALTHDRWTPFPLPAGCELRPMSPDDPALPAAMAVQHLGFAEPGTDVGDAGVDALPGTEGQVDAGHVAALRERVRGGRTHMASLWIDGAAVAAGGHQPLDGVTEIVGVATLPAFRRRGLAAALTSALALDAFERGCELVCLSAGDERVARVYERVGFERVGTFADAAPAGGDQARD